MATSPSTAVATIPTDEGERFNLMQREAKLFAASPLIPQHLRNGGPEQALANCYIALKMARTMGEDPLVVLQNIHVVNGKAGFASQYMIARANSSGVFKGRINWRVDRSDPKNLAVTAFATLADTGELVEFTADMKMAEAEGWTKNPKYRTMPEVMLRYRSAAFLVRFYAPDVMLGYHTTEEVEDVVAANLPAATPLTGSMLIEQATRAEPAPEVRSLAEELDDEIPSFDHADGAPDQEGEAEADAEPEPEPEAADEGMAGVLKTIRAEIAAVKTVKALDAVEKDWVNTHRIAFDDDVAAEVDREIAERRRALKGEG